LGTLPGAADVRLSSHRPDLLRILNTKRERADEKAQSKTLSLGVVITDAMMNAAKNAEDMYQFSPYDVEKEYGEKLSKIGITEHYDELVANPNIRKKRLDPRRLLQTIAEGQVESGYPHIWFVERANNANPHPSRVNMSY